MNKFVSLLSFELNRFFKFLLPAFAITAAVQFFVTFQNIFTYNNDLKKAIAKGGNLAGFDDFSVHYVTQSSLYELSIVLLVMVFIFYSFFTWYREWYGKNSFIYRLLMLPMKRFNIILTKSLVFLIGGFLTFTFQFSLYAIQIKLSEWMIAADHFQAVHIHNIQPDYSIIQAILFPTSGFQFLSIYSFAFAALISLFTGIIIERSFGFKGMISGATYFVGYFIVFGLVTSLQYTQSLPFILRPSQFALLVLGYQFLAILIGYLISNFLLKNKIKI